MEVSNNLKNKMAQQMNWGGTDARVPLLGLPMTSLQVDGSVKYGIEEEGRLDRLDSGFDSGYGLSLSLTDFSKPQDVIPTDLVQNFNTMSLTSQNTTSHTEILTQIFKQDEDGDTQLHLAIIHEETDIAIQIINATPCEKFLNIQNNLRQTPLHLAVCTNQYDVIRCLVARGAMLEVQDHNGNTPLIIACRHGDLTSVKILINESACPQNPEIKNYNGQTCLHVAGEGGHIEILIQLITKLGADVNAVDGRSGRSLLHGAVERRCLPVLALCLRLSPVNVNASAFDGSTPLMLALGRGYHDVAAALVARGAVSITTGYQSDSDSSCGDVTDEYMDL